MTATADFNTVTERNILERLGNSFVSVFENANDSPATVFDIPAMVIGTAGGVIAGVNFATSLPMDMNPLLALTVGLGSLAFCGLAGGALGGVASMTTRAAAYAVLSEAGHQVKNGAAFTYGFLKNSVKSLAQTFGLVKDKMEPEAAQEVQENIDFLNEALREFKDDAVMMVALESCKTLSAEEYKSIKSNYDHLFEGTTSKLSTKEEAVFVFQELSEGKVAQIIKDGKKVIEQPKIIEKMESDPAFRAALDKVNMELTKQGKIEKNPEEEYEAPKLG